MEREKEIINSIFLRGQEYDIDFDDEEEEDEPPFEDAKEEMDSWNMKQTLLLSSFFSLITCTRWKQMNTQQTHLIVSLNTKGSKMGEAVE